MNTERTPYRAEDDEGDDSTAVSFGSGPAFRPVPRIERPAPTPPAEKPPRLPEGLLFDRASHVIRTEAAKQAEQGKEDDEQTTRPARQAPVSIPARPASPAPSVERRQPMSTHLPDIGEFAGVLPEAPPIPEPRPSAEQLGVPTSTEHEPPAQMYPMETVADIPEWPENDQDTVDPPLSPVPPRRSPIFTAAEQFEASAAGTADGNESQVPDPTPHAAGGGGGMPPAPPRPPAGGLPPSPGELPDPRYHNAYYRSGGAAGGAGYNPGGGPPAPNSPSFEAHPAPIIVQKKGNIWPYVAVLAENIARKRADKKLKKELSARMDQQDKLQQETSSNQLHLARQQREMFDQQRRQAIRDAQRPSGREWGVPQYPSVGPERAAPGQRFAGERSGTIPSGAEGQAPMPSPEQQAEAEELQMQASERVKHSAWHTYIEGKSNQEAAQTLHYGEGFRREQKEIVRDHAGDTVAAGVAGAIGTAHALGGKSAGGPRSGVAAGSYYGQGGSQGLPSGLTTPGLPGGTPTHSDAQHQLPSHTPKKSKAHVPGPLFWLMIAMIIVAFFLAANI